MFFQEIFQNPDVTFHTRAIYVDLLETAIAEQVQQVVNQFRDSVLIGSYPDFHNRSAVVQDTMTICDFDSRSALVEDTV